MFSPLQNWPPVPRRPSTRPQCWWRRACASRAVTWGAIPLFNCATGRGGCSLYTFFDRKMGFEVFCHEFGKFQEKTGRFWGAQEKNEHLFLYQTRITPAQNSKIPMLYKLLVKMVNPTNFLHSILLIVKISPWIHLPDWWNFAGSIFFPGGEQA